MVLLGLKIYLALNVIFCFRLFERGLAFVGSDYLSYPLWDEYIRYEEAHQAWTHLAMIYTRILENPIQQLDRYFNWLLLFPLIAYSL